MDRKEPTVMQRGPLLVCGVLLSISALASAQNNDEKKPPDSVFKQVIPKPTGENGYEELILAGELSRQSELARKAMGEEATLTMKRQVLNEPTIQRALALMRVGLSKQTFSPRTDIDDETLLPEFALFRNLGRLLVIEQYVLLADGNVGRAIDSLRDGLLLGYRAQTDTLISGLVGVAINAMVTVRFVAHLEQCSVRDCQKLILLTGEWLDAPSPQLAVMASERAGMQRILQKYRSDSKGLLALLQSGKLADAEQDEKEPTPLEKYLENSPPDFAQIVDEANATLTRIYDEVLTNLRKPAWERKPISVPNDKTLAGELANSLLTDTSRISDRYESERANIRLLGVHAAIRRYRWEYERPPNTLKELRLDKKFTTDPFTGDTLFYRRTGDTYELYSVGPDKRDENNKIISGQRDRIYLPRKPQPSNNP
jgi:hypothetical protein